MFDSFAKKHSYKITHIYDKLVILPFMIYFYEFSKEVILSSNTVFQ